MPLLANLLLLATWVGTHLGAVAWIGAHYTRGDRRLEAFLMAAVVAMAWRRFGGPLPALRRLTTGASPARAPLALLAACLTAELLLAYGLDLQLLRACAFVLGGYALVGLYAAPGTWRAGLPWIGLLTLTLPFGAFSDVYLGFPARLLTADLVGSALDTLGVASLSRDTILVFDRPGGPAAFQVDVPCAGVRSLWSAGVFLLAAACVEGRRLDRWFAAAIVVTGGMLLASNVLRVGALVVLGEVLRAPAIAAAVHVPLGLFGFAWAAAAGWFLLRRASVLAPAPDAPDATGPRALPSLAPLLAAALCLAATLAPAPSTASPALPFTLALPAAMAASPLDPIPAELRFFAEADVPPPRKWRFTSDDLGGTLLVVPSRAWRAHHQPEACLLGQGLTVEGPWTVALDPAFPVRVARVEGGAATAVWWFQSPTRVTEDLAVRTWAALSGAEDRWVLVSLLLDGTVRPADAAPARLLRDLRAAVDRGLAPSLPSPQEAACAPSGPC